MVKITRKEADYMRQNGCGKDIYISSRTHKGRAKRYYLTESQKCLMLLENYRESVKTECDNVKGTI